jgi:hypothetical protein
MTDSGQPTEGGPGARSRADLGLPVHRRIRAVSPQSGPRTCPGPTNLEAGTDPARRACKEPQPDPEPGREAILTLPGPVLPEVCSGTCGTTGSADRARRAGQQGSESEFRRASGRPRVKHKQSRTRGPPSGHRSPEPAAVRGTARMDSENPGAGGRGEPLGVAANHPVRARRAKP